MEILERDYSELVNVYETDCFRRCLRCRIKPFSRIQLETIEAGDTETLVEEVVQYLDEKSYLVDWPSILSGLWELEGFLFVQTIRWKFEKDKYIVL